VMRGERRHDVLSFKFPEDEVFGAVELDTTVGIDLANPRDQAFGNRNGRMTPGNRVPWAATVRLRLGFRT